MILERAREENTSEKRLVGRSGSVDRPGHFMCKEYKGKGVKAWFPVGSGGI